MKISDFETRLDDALNRLAGGISVGAAGGDADVQELVPIVARLQSLAPVPAPHLATSRRRFLAEAARRHGATRWMGLLPRRAWTFALTLVALVAVSVVLLAAWSFAANRQSTPVLQVTLTQTVSPTYSATPAGNLPATVIPSTANRLRLPEPCPTPGTLAMLTETSVEYPSFR